MEIDIIQKKLSGKENYKVFLNGEEKYFAVSEAPSFLACVKLNDLGSDFPRVTIQQQWSWLKSSYTLTFEGGSVTQITTQSIWLRHYQCYVGGSAYDVYGHAGRRFSIYKDGSQIAAWSKQAAALVNGDNYRLLADDNADFDLLIGFCLIIDRQQSNFKGGRGLQLNVGGLGSEAKEFDLSWQPKLELNHSQVYQK